MAKIAYSKLGCKTLDEKHTITFNDQEIEVRKYLPIQEKLELISRVIELAHDEDRNFSNPVKVSIFSCLEIIFAYTNITFTEKQKEDVPKLYDQLFSSGLLEEVMEAIPTEELNTIADGITNSIEAVYKYQNSILGLLDTITTDYDNLNLDLDKIKEKIADPQLLSYVKDMLDKVN